MIKRYGWCIGFCDEPAEFEEKPDGEYVLYDDIKSMKENGSSHNSDYAAALRVVEEYKQVTPEKVRSCLGVECFAKQRLNASHFT